MRMILTLVTMRLERVTVHRVSQNIPRGARQHYRMRNARIVLILNLFSTLCKILLAVRTRYLEI